ncbi:MAG: energy-coupled thiamine transporter ThiT [Bacillus sp. (in: firmicutes)]
MRNGKLVVLIEVAMFAAFALILDLLPSIKIGQMSISFAMVPVFIIAFRWGVKASALAGFLWGLLQIVVGDLQALAIWQVLLEYFLAFACIGAAGLFFTPIQHHLKEGNKIKAVLFIIVATFIGSLARYFWHFIAGATIWASYAPDDMSPIKYSLLFNGVPFLGAFILCSIILAILLIIAPRIVLERPASAQHNSKM